jgi:hypothetical protein
VYKRQEVCFGVEVGAYGDARCVENVPKSVLTEYRQDG